MGRLDEVKSEKLIHLTTQGRKTGRPHIVELWFAPSDSKVYLSHEGNDTDWIKNIKRNPEVSFEIGGRKYIGQAHLIADYTQEAWSAKVALYEKYYNKAAKAVIEDWFSLSKLVGIELN
jgi:deazaflavin-dependent oxidoreductase (nitroreductase family)